MKDPPAPHPPPPKKKGVGGGEATTTTKKLVFLQLALDTDMIIEHCWKKSVRKDVHNVKKVLFTLNNIFCCL